MIQANELRIGNLVLDPAGRMGAVLSVSERSIRLKLEFSTIKIYTTHDETGVDCNPIPLTTQILEKCGFRLSEYAHVKIAYNEIERIDSVYVQDIFNFENKNNMHIEVISDPKTKEVRRIGVQGFNYNGMVGVINTPTDIKYIHQLQNLYFALTGEELTINLQ